MKKIKKNEGLADDQLIAKYENGERIAVRKFEKVLKKMTTKWVMRSLKDLR